MNMESWALSEQIIIIIIYYLKSFEVDVYKHKNSTTLHN